MNQQAKKPRRTSTQVQVAYINAGGFIAAAIITGISTLGFLLPSPTSTPSPSSTSSTVPANAQPLIPTSGLNLEDASQWHIFIDNHGQGSARGDISNVPHPSLDSGQALKVSLMGGDPYVGVQAYRNLAPADMATTFDISLTFFLDSNTTAPVQAFEFTVSKWVNGQRYELALQWEHIGDGISAQDTAFPWRLWTGNNWQDIGVKQQFETRKWHTFHLRGNISSKGLQYSFFSADSIQVNFDLQKFQPFQSVSVPTDRANKLSVGVQLDGDSAEDPYAMYLDGVNFQWS